MSCPLIFITDVKVRSFFRFFFPELESIEIPRWALYTPGHHLNVKLCGFCDASERAYSAVVYITCPLNTGVESTLLISKTKLAPVKIVSIPRLQLCAAVLLSRLITRIASDLDINKSAIFAWPDSRIVLTWLRFHASR